MLTLTPNKMASLKKQQGFTLIDSLIATLILILGSLGIISLQSRMVLGNQLANQRTQASLFASQLLAVANADSVNAPCYVVPVSAQVGCTSAVARSFTVAWISQTTSSLSGSTANLPTAVLNANGTLTVSVFWKLNQEPGFHSFVVTGQVQ
jgi:type IV pilus assembly protein PilV